MASNKIWESVRCVDLVKGRNVIEIDSESSIEAGCEVLVRNGISSAPVYNKKTNSYTGMLDYRDIVAFVLVAFRTNRLPTIKEGVAEEGNDPARINQIIRTLVAGGQATAELVSGIQMSLFLSIYRPVVKESILQHPARINSVCSRPVPIQQFRCPSCQHCERRW